jgi:hypothetical protein
MGRRFGGTGRRLLPLAGLLAAAAVVVSGLPGSGAQPPAAGGVKPVSLPDPKIKGFKFPEDEGTVIGWTRDNKQHEINLHGWGIWTALNLPSGEKADGQELRVFETWPSPQNLVSAHLLGAEAVKAPRVLPAPTVPRQHHRGSGRPQARAAAVPAVNPILVTVQYDPTAAGHITDNGLLRKATLAKLLADGKTDVPAFPVTAVSLKPTYVTATRSELVDGRYFRLDAWPGPPAQPQPFGQDKWKQWVWVDVGDTGPGPGTGKVDTVGTPQSRTPETTYGLGRFIYRRLSPADAETDNAVRAAALGRHAGVAVGGDYRILVGMHVTSREITRWTWQTFWWTPDPDAPPAPSSPAVAKDRPAELKDAPRSYAMSIGYDMLTPATPNTGGGDNGTPIFVYNPWLEAVFDHSDLPDSRPWTFDGKTYDNKFGVQTNCMSCHAQANYPGSQSSGPQYTADQYIDLNGPQFKGVLKVDFLWSLPDQAK